MTVLVTGAAGHLGAVVAAQFAAAGADVVAATRQVLDVCDHRAVESLVERTHPRVVINCSAYTDVDRAEDEPVEALNVNGFAVRVLASASARAGAVFVHYSTDFVFDGDTSVPYREEDPPNPRSAYACSKLIGEWMAREAPRHYVLRVESIFGAPPGAPDARRTSVDRIVDSLAEGREVPVFVDRTVSPSYRLDVAAATQALIDADAPAGLYHCVNSGSCTWEELALEAAARMGVTPRLVPLRMADARLRAHRPRYCALSNAKLLGTGVQMPAWQDALGRYLRARRTTLPNLRGEG